MDTKCDNTSHTNIHMNIKTIIDLTRFHVTVVTDVTYKKETLTPPWHLVSLRNYFAFPGFAKA